MPVKSFTFNPLGENTYVVWDETSLQAAIIDAGMYDRSECEQVLQFINDQHLKLTGLWGTHAHIDHIFGNWWVKQEFPDVPYYLNEHDIKMIDRSETMAALWNLNYTPSPLPDHFLNHGDILKLGTLTFEVRFVPGHAPGHVIFYCATENMAIVGDTIFQGSIGRTDLPGGNHEDLLNHIQQHIFTLPEDTQLHCGHGTSTTVAREIQTNPFFN